MTDFENITTRLTRDTILIGDQVQWKMPLQLQEGEQVQFAPVGETLTRGVEVIGGFHLDTLRHRKGILDLEGRVTVTSFDSGTFHLPDHAALLLHNDGSVDSLLFEGPVLEVTTIPIDTATYRPFDIKQQMGYPVTAGEILPWAGIVLAASASVWYFVRRIRMRRAKCDFFGRPVVKEPAHIVALRSLDRIRRQKIWQGGNQKQFYTAVTDALRIYISDRFEVAAQESTSREILAMLREKGVEKASFDEISELFGRADLVKFAKYTASDAENEETVPQAVRFVNSTFITETEEER